MNHIENITAGENITAPAWVYIKTSDGKAYKANAGTTSNPAVGIVFANAVTNGDAQIMFDGVYDWPSGAFTQGATYYLSASTSGDMTATAPSNAQPLGVAVSSTRFRIEPKPYIPTSASSINGVALSSLSTGVLKNTTGTGVPSIAANTDLPAMTATAGGAVPTPPNNTTTFLRGDASFAAVSGAFLRTQILTSGTTYTPTTGTNTIILTLVGAGGGGGGTKGSASTSAAGGGGGGGGVCQVMLTGISGTYSYSIGTAGAGGSGATPSAGSAGGNTTFTFSGTTYTAYGGGGGSPMTSSASTQVAAGGAGGAVSTNGDVNGAGEPGGWGFTQTSTRLASGHGGSSPWGGGGVGLVTTTGTGNAGAGYGAGGSGAGVLTASNQTGGAGTQGIIIVHEYR